MDSKLKFGALVVVVLGIATVIQFEQVKIKQLVAESTDLRTQLDQMASLQDTNELLAAQLKEAVGTSEANLRESLRLRGQGVRMRQLEQENIQLKAQHHPSERQTLEAQSASADNVAAYTKAVKIAIADYYAKYGSFPSITDSIEPTLIAEGMLEESIPNSSNVRTRTVETSDPMAPVSGANQAYSLGGNGTNDVFGRVVVEAVVGNVTASVARELGLLIDGGRLTSPFGEADLIGRVKFDAIPSEGSGEVHIYISHR